MSDRFFLDTNVLIYSFDRNEPKKRDQARELIGEALKGSKGVISYQVAQEFLSVALRKFAVPFSPAEARRYMSVVLEPLCSVFAGFGLYEQATEISERLGYPFYDSLIIAAALQAECSVLYSEDMQHGQQIGSLRIVNPFL